MDRIQIGLPAEVLEIVRDIAASERRSPKQQIEFFVIQAVREREQADPVPKEAVHAS